MSTKNDNKVMELKSRIQDRKKSIEKIHKNFEPPETNCILELEGESYNLRVLNSDQLKLLLIRLNSYKMSAKNLKIECPNICGFTLSQWIFDLEVKIEQRRLVDEKIELENIEKKLDELLSDDKKTELALSQIESLLSDKEQHNK